MVGRRGGGVGWGMRGDLLRFLVTVFDTDALTLKNAKEIFLHAGKYLLVTEDVLHGQQAQ